MKQAAMEKAQAEPQGEARAAFEAYARGPAGYVDDQLARYADGSYQDSITRTEWGLWQRAWKAATATHPTHEAEPQGEQQPVAWGNFKKDGTCVGLSQHPEDIARWINPKPLYTHPAIDHTALLREARDALENGRNEWSRAELIARLDAALGDKHD